MGYVTQNLMDGENIEYMAKLHWYIFVPGGVVGLLALGLFITAISNEQWGGLTVLSVILLPLALVMLIGALIKKISTELAVTNKRVIAKTGFIKRNTIELNHNKVESFGVDQGILGRIMSFGTLIIQGTGGGKTPIANIDEPLEFRRKALEAVDSSH